MIDVLKETVIEFESFDSLAESVGFDISDEGVNDPLELLLQAEEAGDFYFDVAVPYFI